MSTAIFSTQSPPALLASRSKRREKLRFPPFSVTSPLAREHETVALPRNGRVYSFTTIHPSPKSGVAPFSMGYVDFEGPVRIFGRIRGDVCVGAGCTARADVEFGYVFEVDGRSGSHHG